MRRWTGRAALAAVLFTAAFGWRFLSPDWKNDHFVHLSKAMQVVRYGELPLRDFNDPLHLLKVFCSAGAQVVFGYSLLAEAILTMTFLAAAAVLVFFAAARASRSTLLALLAATSVIVIAPRLYNYQKIFLPALALPLLWRYADRPSASRLAAVSFATALSVGFRLDQGATIAVAAAVMLLAVHGREGPKRLSARTLSFAGLTTLFLLPWLAFVSQNGGLLWNLQKTLEVGRAEAERTVLLPLPRFQLGGNSSLLSSPEHGRVNIRWRIGLRDAERGERERRYDLAQPQPLSGTTWQYDLRDTSTRNLRALISDPEVEDTHHIDRKNLRVLQDPGSGLAANATALLYYLFFSIPLLAAAGALRRSLGGTRPPLPEPLRPAHILTAAALALVMNVGHLRALPLEARIPDAVVPNVVLGAWLLRATMRPRQAPAPRIVAGLVLATLAALTWGSFAVIGNLGGRLNQIGFWGGPSLIGERAVQTFDRLRASPPEVALVSTKNHELSTYVNRCTRPSDRLLIIGVAPEIYYFSDRGFAGGLPFFIPGYWSSPEDQVKIVARLERSPPPIVLLDLAAYPLFEPAFPAVDQYLSLHYRAAGVVTNASGRAYRVLADTRRTPTGTYGPLGLPSFR